MLRCNKIIITNHLIIERTAPTPFSTFHSDILTPWWNNQSKKKQSTAWDQKIRESFMKNDRVGTACVCVRGIISTVTPKRKKWLSVSFISRSLYCFGLPESGGLSCNQLNPGRKALVVPLLTRISSMHNIFTTVYKVCSFRCICNNFGILRNSNDGISDF